MIPAEAREELLRQQFEDQLYVGTLLRDVWHVKELAQLNGAELTEIVKHLGNWHTSCNLVSWILSPDMEAFRSIGVGITQPRLSRCFARH